MQANLLDDLPDARPEEVFTAILTRPRVRIERIVSHGQVTPQDAPYDQAEDEWVLLLQGAAELWMAGAEELTLQPGDQVLIPARRLHRVTWTAADEPTVWLVVFLPPDARSPEVMDEAIRAAEPVRPN